MSKTTLTRGAAIATKCRECITDPCALGTWREQVAVCACTDCPLWRFRPLSRNSPAWIASRDPADLPQGFARIGHDAAILALRAGIDGKADGCVVHALRGTRGADLHPYPRPPAARADEVPRSAGLARTADGTS